MHLCRKSLLGDGSSTFVGFYSCRSGSASLPAAHTVDPEVYSLSCFSANRQGFRERIEAGRLSPERGLLFSSSAASPSARNGCCTVQSELNRRTVLALPSSLLRKSGSLQREEALYLGQRADVLLGAVVLVTVPDRSCKLSKGSVWNIRADSRPCRRWEAELTLSFVSACI